jgi:PAS domain S-box-containing protein
MADSAGRNSNSNISGLYSTAPLGTNRLSAGADGLSLAHKDFLDRAFFALKTIAQGGDYFIAIFYPDRPPRIEWATGIFSPHLSKPLSVDMEPLKSLSAKPEPVVYPDSTKIKGGDPFFLTLPAGSLALVPFDLSSDIFAVLGQWLAPHHGRITPDKLTALRCYTEILEHASAAPDLEQDIRTHQAELEMMHEETDEIRQFFRQFSESVSQCFWVIDLDTSQTVLASDNFEVVWGASRKILTNGMTGFMDNVFPEDRDRVLADFHLAMGSPINTELRVIEPDGELRWIWLRSFMATPDPKSDRLTNRLVMIADDITEKKNQEELLRERETRLISKSNALAIGDLASGVAHEINNPLTVIIGKSMELRRLAERDQLTPEKLTELTDKIENTSIRISEIIQSLKALARQDKTQGVQNLPVSKIFADLADICSEKFKAAGVQLELPLSDSSLTSPLATPLTIDMNATLIMQMLLNLLNNAFDAVQVEKKKWVKLEVIDNDDDVFFYVTDSGPGIPIKVRGRIFDPFFTTKERTTGTGLGLSLALSIALHHNGTLKLDNLHTHTRFVAQIPKKQTF